MNAANSQIIFLGLLFFFLAGASAIGIYIIYTLRKRAGQGDSSPQSSMIEDQTGVWWYQDPDSGNWHWWTGEEWAAAETGPNVKHLLKRKRPGNNRSCAVTLSVLALLTIVVGGGIALLGFGFFPGFRIPVSTTFNLTRVLKFGGSGLLLFLAGSFLLRRGSWGLISNQEEKGDAADNQQKARGCFSLLWGFTLVFTGFIMAAAGIGLMALIIIQEILPTIGEIINFF